MTIKAAVVADSISEDNIRITTMELTYPRFIHAEFMTHRMFSRNASSSRAIPVQTMIDRVRKDPARPIHWGANRPGMQADDELDPMAMIVAKQGWDEACLNALDIATKLAQIGAHKQIVNRILEPFAHITVLVTATEWENFYNLRRHPDAQPEIHALADTMYAAQQKSEPTFLKHGDWHLPYIMEADWDGIIKAALNETPEHDFNYAQIEARASRIACEVSTARCARVSYLTHDSVTPSVEKDRDLFRRLILTRPMHASPAEHQATPDRIVKYGTMSVHGWENPHTQGNFVGWQQHRKFFYGENVPTNTLSSGGVVTSVTKNNVVRLTERVDKPTLVG